MNAYDRMSVAPCLGFRWIGQSLAHCDECGEPYWEHSHECRPDGPFGRRWRRLVIRTTTAEACRRKWGRRA